MGRVAGPWRGLDSAPSTSLEAIPIGGWPTGIVGRHDAAIVALICAAGLTRAQVQALRTDTGLDLSLGIPCGNVPDERPGGSHAVHSFQRTLLLGCDNWIDVSPDTQSDSELLGWSVAGDIRAFSELVRRHEVAVHGFLARRVGPGLVEDLLADVWSAAFAGRGAYDRSWPNARPWLYGIARNVVSSRLRKDRRVEPPSPAFLDPWPAVDDRIDGAAAVKEAVKGLPDKERDVLLLVVWEQLTVVEAAVTLGIPAGTARSRLHRARIALRERLDGGLNDPWVPTTREAL